MSERHRQDQPPSFPRHRWRMAALVTVPLGLVGTALALSSVVQPDGTDRASTEERRVLLRVRDGERVLTTLRLDRFRRSDGSLARRRLSAAVRRAIPSRVRAVRGRATVIYRLDGARAARRALRIGAVGGTVRVRRTPVASRIDAPIVRQRLRNICEAAALQVLLATSGVVADQLRIQARLPRSGTPDPLDAASGRVWGDPELGYVGRPDGGGVAGGFGVYQRPIAQVARRYGRRLDDLTATSPQRIYRRLLRGRAVMVWVGLSNGPYGEWRSPQGRQVRVNFGEHTVVLVGVRGDGILRVVNPLEGTAELWSKAKFEAMWALLGRRALST